MLHYTPGIRCVIMQNKKNISHAMHECAAHFCRCAVSTCDWVKINGEIVLLTCAMWGVGLCVSVYRWWEGLPVARYCW